MALVEESKCEHTRLECERVDPDEVEAKLCLLMSESEKVETVKTRAWSNPEISRIVKYPSFNGEMLHDKQHYYLIRLNPPGIRRTLRRGERSAETPASGS
jgi:hypothetical protein